LSSFEGKTKKKKKGSERNKENYFSFSFLFSNRTGEELFPKEL
jgi:hypothetical protein